MTTISWKTGVSGTWTDAANWTPTAVPGAGDDVLIGAAGSYLIDVAGATVNSISLNDSAATLLSSGTLTVNAGLALGQGTLDIATGSVIALGPFSNTGTVIDTGSLLLFGHYDAESIEWIGGSGGTLELASSLANAGGTL